MKKVKIMLTAITVMAVVGGALAFKANKFNTKLYCTSQAAPNACTITKDGFSIAPELPGDPSVGSSSCTTTTTGDCAFRPTYLNQ